MLVALLTPLILLAVLLPVVFLSRPALPIGNIYIVGGQQYDYIIVGNGDGSFTIYRSGSAIATYPENMLPQIVSGLNASRILFTGLFLNATAPLNNNTSYTVEAVGSLTIYINGSTGYIASSGTPSIYSSNGTATLTGIYRSVVLVNSTATLSAQILTSIVMINTNASGALSLSGASLNITGVSGNLSIYGIAADTLAIINSTIALVNVTAVNSMIAIANTSYTPNSSIYAIESTLYIFNPPTARYSLDLIFTGILTPTNTSMSALIKIPPNTSASIAAAIASAANATLSTFTISTTQDYVNATVTVTTIVDSAIATIKIHVVFTPESLAL